MCRFALYLGPPVALGALLTRPERSLRAQARHSDLTQDLTSGDGCGVVWYAPDELDTPLRFRDAAPAWASAGWECLGETHESACMLAHVRAATGGTAVSMENCHPFVWRRLAFMHNGALPSFGRFAPALLDRISPRARGHVFGTTDSELIFALYTDHWLALDEQDPLARLCEALRRTIAELEQLRFDLGISEPAYLNLAVADGRRAVASRHVSPGPAPPNSLFVSRSLSLRRDAVPAVLIASEPLDRGPGWSAVPDGHMAQVAADGRLRLIPLLPRSLPRAA